MLGSFDRKVGGVLMAGHNGIELKNIVYEPGENRTKVSADIFVGKSRVGEVLDDGWCDEIYIEFIDDKNEKLFLKRKEGFCIKKNLSAVSAEDLLRELIYEDRIKMIRKQSRGLSKPCKQLSFIE
jgi:hypothetical protein